MIDQNNFKYQKEGAGRDLVNLLMEEYHWDMDKALDSLYNSETFNKICNPLTGLYFQSSLYLYSFFKEEIENGVMK